MTKNQGDYDKLKIERYTYWTLYLHDKQSYLGRCYIALNRSGILDPFADITRQEKDELESIVLKTQAALDKLYKPDLYNYANFRNSWPHCHWHIIPRYKAPRLLNNQEFVDENWGKNYAPYDRNFKLSDELLESIKKDIRKELRTNI